MDRFGKVVSYVNEALGQPLVVTDDDISGTFTFIRALEDYGFSAEPTSAQIGQTWLNYLVEGKTILWWGGRGTSTEHTAYLNLKRGLKAPLSGSAATNGSSSANQIGAMIFIDGWAMVAPADPSRAARLAREAAKVSHDEEAVNAAAFIAAMESAAYVEEDLDGLLDAGIREIPVGSALAALARAIRGLRDREPDWRRARAWLEADYGYDRYPGTCHVIPNFGLILLALLYGGGDFRESISIACTAGWDTDCNAANLGCLLGIRNGLGALQACPDLRLAHRDLMYVSSADGGRGITDAAREALRIANTRFRMAGEALESPKAGARYPFAFPGALHGFRALREKGCANSVLVENGSRGEGRNALRVRFEAPIGPALVALPVFKPPRMPEAGSYDFQASPCLYPGQILRAPVYAAAGNTGSVVVRPFVSGYGPGDEPRRHFGDAIEIAPGVSADISWTVDGEGDYPLFEAGFELASGSAEPHEVWIDSVDWRGVPDLVFERPYPDNRAWKGAWVDAVHSFAIQFAESFHLSQNDGVGLVIQGMREWRDYEVGADVTLFGARAAGVAARVQGLKRYYALLLRREGKVQLLRELDGATVLWEASFPVEEARKYEMTLLVDGARIAARVDGVAVVDMEDPNPALESGALGLVVEEGTLVCRSVTLKAARPA